MKRLAVILCCTLIPVGCSTPSAIDLHTQQIAVIDKIADVSVQAGAGRYKVGYDARLDRVNAVQATIRLSNPGSDPRWRPVCSIVLREADELAQAEKDENPDGLHASSLRVTTGAAPNLFVDEYVNKTQRIQLVGLENIIPIGASVPIRMWWMNGEVVVEENGRTRTKILIDWPIRTLRFIGSTADCRFSEIALGTMGK